MLNASHTMNRSAATAPREYNKEKTTIFINFLITALLTEKYGLNYYVAQFYGELAGSLTGVHIISGFFAVHMDMCHS